ncbi:MAG: Holliday junction branch migration protein RuvA [Patescibacteria group bacterium]|nr:Holliday junction branch migration protein RuvA [Patescibacteria group bacterium]
MISKIKGKIASQGPNYLIIQTAALGFKIYLNPIAIAKTRIGRPIELFTYLAVRENALDLYGFFKKQELELFELLISVSGIGPKGAQAILAQAGPKEICASIASADDSVLTRVSGIGKKTAQRVILELKTKVDRLPYTSKSPGKKAVSDIETLDALISLGYSQAQAAAVLKKISPDLKKTSDKIKTALKLLGS